MERAAAGNGSGSFARRLRKKTHPSNICLRKPTFHLRHQPAPSGGARIWSHRGEGQDWARVIRGVAVGVREARVVDIRPGYPVMRREMATLASVWPWPEVWV